VIRTKRADALDSIVIILYSFVAFLSSPLT